jgi:hypothetical protein
MGLDVFLAAVVIAVLPGLSAVAVALGRQRWRAAMHEFWNQQLHLHQLYLNSFGVSGGDALDALAQRKRLSPSAELLGQSDDDASGPRT